MPLLLIRQKDAHASRISDHDKRCKTGPVAAFGPDDFTMIGNAPAMHFLLPNGTVQTVAAARSLYTVMAAAKNAGVPGIEGHCGGNRACTTCHVHIARKWLDAVGPPGPEERALLELTDDYRPESRLSCQIAISEVLDGIELTPAS